MIRFSKNLFKIAALLKTAYGWIAPSGIIEGVTFKDYSHNELL